MKRLLLPAVLLCTAMTLSAGGSGMFELSLRTEALLSGAGIVVNLGGMYFTSTAVSPAMEPTGARTVPVFPYSGVQDDIGTVLSVAGALALPLLLDRWELSQAGVIGMMYLETVVLAWGSKDLLKGLFPKNRPYVYGEATPAELLAETDRYFSFPSGHTTMAFATAAFSSFVFSRSSADTGTKILFSLGAFGLASAVGLLRVTSGSHYPADVALGAVIGTTYGILVPLAHFRREL